MALLGTATAAEQRTPEFSADIVYTIPQQGTQKGRIFIGKEQARTEFTMNGKTLVQIVNTGKQEVLLLDTREKTSMRHKAGMEDAVPAGGSAKEANPCAGMQNMTCRQLGTETINGRTTQKWEFTGTTPGQTGKMTTWLDEERQMPVRQIMPDGSSMEMRLVGNEKLDGRETERWEMTTSRTGGQSQVSHQWYDPQLGMNIREERPDGYIRALVNIKTGAQPESLFAVPAGYREISAPAGRGMAPGPGRYR